MAPPIATLDTASDGPGTRKDELNDLLAAVRPLLDAFVSGGDASIYEDTVFGPHSTSLIAEADPAVVQNKLSNTFPVDGQGRKGLVESVGNVLECSVNTWHQGFLSKLYAAPNPVGIISELVLAILNTNVHVYDVSPALSTIERAVGKKLASMFGLVGEHAGGLSQQGGSSSNLTALIIARNTMFPDIKTDGTSGKKLVIFTSAHGHYSFEKAAQICGLGSNAVWPVEVDEQGSMLVSDLEQKIADARARGYTPFFVNATAGTTVLGSYDPMHEIGVVCQKQSMWFHVDASWGGAVIFSSSLRHKMHGSSLAQTVTYNPHKMLNVPVTCSFLLVADLTKAWKADTLPANYLFHEHGDGDDSQLPRDIADMTLQCGRRGDALKLALAWVYYGTRGFEERIDGAFQTASLFARYVRQKPHLLLVSTDPPPCLQVCFFFAKEGRLGEPSENSRITKSIVQRLSRQGFAVDFASEARGHFLRVVVNLETRESTITRLVEAVEKIGLDVGS